ncbi:MAG: hypothetical protein K5924_02565 [Chloroflexi bacterium]|nr:hypothetical protein [Chloroflexota bacterium]
MTPTPTPAAITSPQGAPTADRARLNPWLLWRPEQPAQPNVLSVAELAECHCPDLCDRDHANE